MFKPISRRTLLRGAGASVGASMALPWLETMASAAPADEATRLAEPPLRMMFMFMPNGVRPDYWTPPGDAETDYPITPHLKPLEGLRNDFTLLENLWNKNSIGRNGHWPKVPVWLSGGYVQRTTADDLDTGAVSVDQLAGQRIGDRTFLPTLELGLEAPRTGIDTAGGGFARLYGSFISWRDPHTPVPKEIIPQLAFDRLFRNSRGPVLSGANPKDPALLTALQRDDSSILDLVMEDAKSVKRQGSRSDKVRLDEYFESVRSVERRLQSTLVPQKRWINQGKFPLDRPAPRHSGHACRAPETDARHFHPRILDGHDTHRHLHVRRRAEQQGLLFPARRPRRVPLDLASWRGGGAPRAVREDHQLAHRATGILPEPREESRRGRHVAAR
jgi:hypothetical protein